MPTLKKALISPLPWVLLVAAAIVFWPAHSTTLYRLCTFPGTYVPADCPHGHRITDVFGATLGGLVGIEWAILFLVLAFLLGLGISAAGAFMGSTTASDDGEAGS